MYRISRRPQSASHWGHSHSAEFTSVPDKTPIYGAICPLKDCIWHTSGELRLLLPILEIQFLQVQSLHVQEMNVK